VASTLGCLRDLGVAVTVTSSGDVQIDGRGPRALRRAAGSLDAGNSGTTMRLLSGILAGSAFTSIMTGDESLRRRPMRRVIEPLTAMGAHIISHDGRAPLKIQGGGLHGIAWHSPVASAQIKSAVLLAGLLADGTTTVTEPLPSRDHTERLLPVFGVELSAAAGTVSIRGGQVPAAPRDALLVPGDPSASAVWAAAAAALPGSQVRIEGVCLNPLRLGFVAALERMGAAIVLEETGQAAGEPVGAITVAHGAQRHVEIGAAEVPSLIDELPVLAASAALGGGISVSGASELRVKESDRISALVTGFRLLGLEADERPDGFVVPGGQRPSGGTADAVSDHRLVMAFAIVAMGATGPASIVGADIVGVSYPAFERDLATLTAS
jgi:3-phosphoshikimate 1-carboxyvinyltransferase